MLCPLHLVPFERSNGPHARHCDVPEFFCAKPLGLLLIYEPYISIAEAGKRPVDHMSL